jgi:hypothetical protein
VRFLVELDSDDDGRVSGEVTVADGSPAPFSGWLGLLRLLEAGTEAGADRGGPVSGGPQ